MILGSLQAHASALLVEGGYPHVSGQPISGFRRSSRCKIVGQIWKSKMNGIVYDPTGIAPCICVGKHSGVEPKIIVYAETEETE